MSVMPKEYGGYLPFEIHKTEDWFSKYGEKNVLRTNSAKAAMYFAIKNNHIQKVYIPHYMCRSVKEMLLETGAETEYYYLDEKLLPKLGSTKPGEAVLLVNYFGMMEELVRKEAEKYQTVILDHSHAFFAEPVIREGVFNIYSCRKFIGVPDGGCLISGGAAMELEPDTISGHFSYLVTSLEYGTNAAYQEKMESDRYFAGNYKGMSRLSQGMLSSVDYSYIRQCRSENFRYLHELLQEENLLEIPQPEASAYLYPFLPKRPAGSGKSLKSELVAEKIYVPTLWRELICESFAGTIEYELSEGTVFLPIDQRYGKDDMEYLAGKVKKILEENK